MIRGQLVVFAGANTVTGPVAHYLGCLAAQLGRLDEAADLLGKAAVMEQEIGALPWLGLTLAALAETLRQRGRGDDSESAAGHRRQAGAIAAQLGMPGLLAALAPATVPADEWALRRDGADWLLSAGREQVRLRDSRGMHYLRALLAAPGTEIAALDLVAGGVGLRVAAAEPVLDDAAMDAYRRRLAELAAELDAADQAGDAARAGRAEDERQAVLAELRRAAGLWRPVPPGRRGRRTGPGQRDPHAAHRARPHLRRRPGDRRPPGGLGPHRARLPLPASAGRPGALAGLSAGWSERWLGLSARMPERSHA